MQGVFCATMVGLESRRGRKCGMICLRGRGLRLGRTDTGFTAVEDLHKVCKGLESVDGLSFVLLAVFVDGFGDRSQSSRFALFRFFAIAESLRYWAAASASPLHFTSVSSKPSVLGGTGSVNKLATRASSVSVSSIENIENG